MWKKAWADVAVFVAWISAWSVLVHFVPISV